MPPTVETTASKAPAVSIVIPVYNEQDGVDALARALRDALATLGRSYEIVIVDDGSTDDTWNRLRRVASADAHWRSIRLKRNFGQTAAMCCGIEYAKGPVIVTMDGDLQNDPADIPRLLQKMEEGYDVICGWRYQRQDKLLSRKIPSMVANRLIGWLTGVRLHDYGCSLKAYRAEVIKRTPLYAEFHRFITALVSLNGALVAEMKVNHRPRTFGRTKYNLWRTWRVSFDMVTVAMLVKCASKPLRLFGCFALGVGVVTAACFIRAWGWYVGPFHRIPQVLPGVIVLGGWLAGHLMLVGLMAELVLVTAHRPPQRLIAAQESSS